VDPIQRRYEVIRPLVLFAEGTAAQRAQDTRNHPDTVRRWLHDFRQHGMLGLLPAAVHVEQRRRGPSVSEAVRQEIDRLKTLYGGLTPPCADRSMVSYIWHIRSIIWSAL
jgi:hypothetical protein